MEVFINLAKEPSKLSDLKQTFDVVAKFSYPHPSQTQKSDYFQDKFDEIFGKFYTHLKNCNFFIGQSQIQIGLAISNGIQFSEIIMKFDSWLDQQSNIFNFEQKSKNTAIKPQNSYSNTNANINQPNKYMSNPTTTGGKYFQISKIQGTNHAFNIIEKHTNSPVPSHKQQINNNISAPLQKNIEKHPKIENYKHTVQQFNTNPQKYPQQVRPQMYPQRFQEKPKGNSNFYEKLSQFFDCPQRAYIIRGQIEVHLNKRKQK